jgi:hypothetical protein
VRVNGLDTPWVASDIAADLPVMPLVILSFGAIAWARLRAESKVELPSSAAAR